MIPFLVKLANLLDDRGQHSMAREVDDLIEKLAQMSSPDDLQSVQPEPEQLQSVQPPEPVQSIAPPAQPQVSAPAKKKPRPNPVVMQIQKNLGVKQDGLWGPKTNKAFMAAMSSLPEYAKMIEGGKFKGTLQQAEQMTQQLLSYKEMDKAPPQQDVASKAPAAPVKSPFKSKYDLMDIQDMSGKLAEKGWTPDQIQALIGVAEDAADKAAGQHPQKQDAFERYFNNRARQSI